MAVVEQEMTEKSEQWIIENEWAFNKLLVTNMNPKMFLFEIVPYGIYVQNVRAIQATLKNQPDTPYRFGNARQPHMVQIRSEEKDSVLRFIADHPEFQCSRVFKSGLYFPNLNARYVGGFCKTAVKNALYLRPGSAFYFLSNRKEISDRMYKDAVLINDQEELGCTFDFDRYDYKLETRVYKRDNGTYALVCILYGWDLPNHWHA